MAEYIMKAKQQVSIETAYSVAHFVTQDLIERLQVCLHDMPAPDTPQLHWGHVGDVLRINTALVELVESLEKNEAT